MAIWYFVLVIDWYSFLNVIFSILSFQAVCWPCAHIAQANMVATFWGKRIQISINDNGLVLAWHPFTRGSTLHMNLPGINVINYFITVIIAHYYYQQKYLYYWLVCMLDWLFGPYTHYFTIAVLRWVPTKKVKVQGLSGKSGKIKMMCVWVLFTFIPLSWKGILRD